MSLAQIKNQMAEMKFKGMLAHLESTLAEATSASMSYTDLLDQLLQAEYEDRESRRTTRRIKNAKLRQQARFEEIDTTAKRSLTKAQIKELYALEWLKQHRPVLLIGQTGVGKTFLAEAISLHACERGFSALFTSASEFFENLAMARAAGTYLKMRDRMIKPDLLAIDDLGLRGLTATEAHDLCEILEARSIEKSTLITTQLPLDNWAEVIGDPVVADAIIDRVKHTALTLNITGESYRRKKAQSFDKKSRK